MLDDLDLAVQASQIRVGGTLDTCWLESDVWIEAWAVLGSWQCSRQVAGTHACNVAAVWLVLIQTWQLA